jgi:glycopeptide antibiotics resistance protein
MVKSLPKLLLAVYVLFLAWLILFKTSIDFSSVLFDYQSRSLNLVPFVGYSTGMREMLENLIVFVPLGLLLSVNFKQVSFWRKLALLFFFSFAAEAIQYALAIGTTDITDLIMNTLGGLIGLVAYGLGSRWIDPKKLDGFILVTVAILLALLLALRFFVFRVRY